MRQNHTPTFSPLERLILENLGGHPWSKRSLTPRAVLRAKKRWAAVHAALGFKASSSGWMTTEKSNPKLGKNGLPSQGLTLLSHNKAAEVWSALTSDEQVSLAEALGVEVDTITAAVPLSTCPCSTTGCRLPCVSGESGRAQMVRSQKARLGRTLMVIFRPKEAMALTANMLKALADTHGRRGARWRVNVADDIRWELVAPGLFSVAPRAYGYTKWSPAQRPGRPGFRLVYSVTEKWSEQRIVDMCAKGNRVALVVEIAKGEPIPTTIYGVPTVDGDLTDDLWKHPAGHIVALRSKGTHKQREHSRCTGFSRAIDPVPVTVTLPVRRTHELALAS